MDSITSGAGSDGDDWIADAFGLRTYEIILVHKPDAHRVDEWIPLVGGVENDFSGDGRNPDAVAVITDAFYHPREQIPHACVVEAAEAKRVEHRDRAGSHRENIAQDAADAGGRSLVWLYCGRMIVRLDLERDGESIADGDDASVLAGSLKDVRRGCRQRLQKRARVLVRAVLAPQRADDPQLGEGRRAAKHRHQPVVLLGVEAVLRHERRGDRRITGARRDLGHARPPRGRGSIRADGLRHPSRGEGSWRAPGAASCPAHCPAR